MEEIKCAVYTRKSTDEGLEKEFNTLEAQREAGENYVLSQKHQGWRLIDEHYDDGGFSGGNMNRPALKRLMTDIENGKVNMIVVYKIDRLTRSLTDFAKMVDIFDAHKCSFVSVTQNFNTADSMGRLTLNMLLSFAQFEREISGERIRDKVAASKKKGMWMGGATPYGYECINKRLVIKPQEAEAIKFMYDNYLKYKSPQAVAVLMEEKGYKKFTRMSVTRMLKNPIYMGKIKHKNEVYNGQHEGIVSEEIFKAAQNVVVVKDRKQQACLYNRNEVGIMRGLLTCGCCHATMSPTACQGHGVKRYYYTSLAAKRYGYHKCTNGAIPLAAMDECMIKIVSQLFQDPKVFQALLEKVAPNKSAELFKVLHTPEKVFNKIPERHKLLLMRLLITGVTVNYDTLEINWTDLGVSLLSETLKERTSGHQTILPTPFIRHKGKTEVHLPETISTEPHFDKDLIRGICQGFKLQKMIDTSRKSIAEIAIHENMDAGDISRLLRLTSLSPAIIRTILKGHQPSTLYLRDLLRKKIPPIWEDQHKMFGFKILD